MQSAQLPDFSVGLIEGRRFKWPHALGRWIGPFQWDSWVIDWIAWRGSRLAVSTDGKNYVEMERPQWSWCIFAPHVWYKHIDAGPLDEAFDALWFYFTLPKPWPQLTGRPFSFITDPEERFGHRVREMYALQQSGEPGASLMIHAQALTVFAEIIAASQRGGDGSARHPWRVQGPSAAGEGGEGNAVEAGIALLRSIDGEVMRAISQPPTMDELAERLNMSVSSLAHRFRKETGMTVMERVRWLRIREARALLSQRGASVKSVARKLAFSSPFHLSTMFRQITGVTPAAYMKQNAR